MTMSLFAARRSPPSARRPALHRFTAMVVLISFFIGCTQSAPAAKPRVARDRGVGQAPVNSDEAALLVAGALFAQSYFDGDDPTEKSIGEAAETLYARIDWTWEQVRPPAISMGWTPEQGFHTYDWRGLNEAMIVVLLALGSPTH